MASSPLNARSLNTSKVLSKVSIPSRSTPVLNILRPYALSHANLTSSLLVAYLLGYTTTTTPRIASICARYVAKRLKQRNVESPKDKDSISSERELISRLLAAVKGGVRFDGFAMVCVIILGGRKVLEPVISKIGGNKVSRETGTFIASLGSAFAGMTYWHAKHPKKRTVDLTLAALVRAIDVIVQRLWRGRPPTSRAEGLLKKEADTIVFAVSCTIIMFAWFYTPERLPNSYNDWIMRMAAMDERLLFALRYIRNGELEYGVRGKYTSYLEPYARDLGYDEKMGDLVETIPIPCRLVHEGYSESCEVHALWRWRRAFQSALMIYLPINTLLLLRGTSKRAVRYALISSLRSSAFLATFVSLTWYGVCLTRSRLGPTLFPSKSRTLWDDTSGPLLGCLLCGWSILLESPKRRGEMALYVAPRAMATILPVPESASIREGKESGRKRLESITFAVSLAVLMTASKYGGKDGVRGFIGGTLKKLMDM